MSRIANGPKGPIDFTRLTDGQATQIQRIAQTGARIGFAQQKVHAAILDAVRNSFDAMLETADDDDLVHEVFAALGRAATTTNPKRIANHPLCPEDVVEEIAARLAEKPNAAEVKTAPIPKPPVEPGEKRTE